MTVVEQQRQPETLAGLAPPPSRLRRLAESPVFTNRQSLAGITILVLLILTALIGPLFLSGDAQAKVGPVFAPPSHRFWLGTDGGGSDMLGLLVVGARVSLLVGFASAAVSVLIGGTIGLLSGFFGGKTDIVLMRLTDYMLVLPDIPLMIVVAALFGRSLTNIILIIGAIYWTSTARLLRAQVKSVRERVYVHRARALGAGNTRLIFRHVLPQVTPLLVANTVLFVAYAIFAETFITFLGLGDPSMVSWGRLIQNAFQDDAILNNAWWAVVPPGVAVVIVVVACTMVGQAMEDAFNPRLRSGHLSVHRFRLRQVPPRELS
jgi:peptide/nickel transport system permease protein